MNRFSPNRRRANGVTIVVVSTFKGEGGPLTIFTATSN